MATVSAPEVGWLPGCGLPSYGEMVSDGPGLLDARCLPVALCAQDDVGTPGGGIRDLGRSDLPPGDGGVPRGSHPSLAGNVFQLEIDCHTRFLIHNVCSGCPASVGLGGPR